MCLFVDLTAAQFERLDHRLGDPIPVVVRPVLLQQPL
jgi:hypothetical protein